MFDGRQYVLDDDGQLYHTSLIPNRPSKVRVEVAREQEMA